MSPVAVGLLHHPIYDKARNIVATNVLNLDIHDIARACRSYGVDRYYLIHPAREQLMFVSRVIEHWRLGRGKAFNAKRADSLRDTTTAESIGKALSDFRSRHKGARLIGTSAREFEGIPRVKYSELKAELSADGAPTFLLFGTGYGMADEVIKQCDALLEPIYSRSTDGFNHLSVRSAVSISLDRLLSSC